MPSKRPYFKANFIFLNNFCDWYCFAFLILYFWESELYSRFLVFAFWYLLSILYLWESNLQYPISLRGVITGLIALSPFDSPFSPPGHLCLLHPLSLLYLTLWTSLDVLGCGEPLGNWLLARLVSHLLMPPLLLVTSILPPPPSLFYVSLWVSLGVPDCGEHLGNWSLARLFLPLWLPLFSSWSPLSPSSPFSSPCNSVNLSGCPLLWRIISPLT